MLSLRKPCAHLTTSPKDSRSWRHVRHHIWPETEAQGLKTEQSTAAKPPASTGAQSLKPLRRPGNGGLLRFWFPIHPRKNQWFPIYINLQWKTLFFTDLNSLARCSLPESLSDLSNLWQSEALLQWARLLPTACFTVCSFKSVTRAVLFRALTFPSATVACCSETNIAQTAGTLRRRQLQHWRPKQSAGSYQQPEHFWWPVAEPLWTSWGAIRSNHSQAFSSQPRPEGRGKNVEPTSIEGDSAKRFPRVSPIKTWARESLEWHEDIGSLCSKSWEADRHSFAQGWCKWWHPETDSCRAFLWATCPQIGMKMDEASAVLVFDLKWPHA